MSSLREHFLESALDAHEGEDADAGADRTAAAQALHMTRLREFLSVEKSESGILVPGEELRRRFHAPLVGGGYRADYLLQEGPLSGAVVQGGWK